MNEDKEQHHLLEALREIQNIILEPIAINQNHNERMRKQLNECYYIAHAAIAKAEGQL